MSWGAYYFFYDCPQCGKKYRWLVEDMTDPKFAQCPACHVEGKLVGETKNVQQGDTTYLDYEDV